MFWKRVAGFYEGYENLGLKVTFLLIALQVIHLYWLTTTVVIARLFGENLFLFPQVPTLLFVVIDYLEIPALFTGMVFYALQIHDRGGRVRKNLIFISLLAVQVFHIFWITDDVVYTTLFNKVAIEIPLYLAWAAIFVDYLELPVVGDLFAKIIRRQRQASTSRSRSA